MKKEEFKKKRKFDNVFAMMNFCYKHGLTSDNSILEESDDGETRVLYYN